VTPTYRRFILADKMKFYDECRTRHRAWLDGGKVGAEPPDIDRMKADNWDPVAIDRALPPDPRKHIHAFPAFGTYFYNFNCLPTLQDGRRNPFADKRVRRAFAMALDKRRITEDVRGIGERIATTLIPPNSLAGYPAPAGLPFDPERARKELADAGYPGGKGFPAVEILFNRDGGHDVIAQAIAKDWSENLGVDVELAMREIKVFRNDLKNQNFMTSRAGWYGDYGDPTTFLDLNRTGDGNNDRKFSSAKFDALLDRANAEPDAAKRLQILYEAEKMIVEDELPLIPIFHYVQMSMFDPDKVSGISSHPRQEQNMYQVDILGDGKGADKPLALPPGKSRMSNRTGTEGN
jgi:oligopeptide transport system substrate-binding protein